MSIVRAAYPQNSRIALSYSRAPALQAYSRFALSDLDLARARSSSPIRPWAMVGASSYSAASALGNATNERHVSFVFVHHKAGSSSVMNLLNNALPGDARGTRCLREITCTDATSSCPWARSEKDIWHVDKGLLKNCNHGFVILLRSPINPSLIRNSIAERYLSGAASCTAIFQLRHPWDTLVSMYNSFTSTHPPPPSLSKSQAAAFRLEQAKQHSTGIDVYSLKYQTEVRQMHEWIIASAAEARRHGCSTWMSRYEQMVEDPKGWQEQFGSVMRLKSEKSRKVLRSWAAEESRLSSDERWHTAYVHPGAFASKLQPATILQLLSNLSAAQLQKSGYF